MTAWDKTDIINILADLYGYTSYLEICTPTTGNVYGKIDRSKFRTCHRLMYRSPAAYDDNMDINFRSSHLGTRDLFETIHAFGWRYDVILVDSFHTYDVSYRDLADAFGVVADRGTIVVHDCLPPHEGLISPEFVVGSWCGLSFMAFIDFVIGDRALTYLTVDTDAGCGVIRKDVSPATLRSETRAGWEAVRHDANAAFRFMTENKGPLLNLLPVEEFKRAELQRVRAGGGQTG
jgi:hypothetical protein